MYKRGKNVCCIISTSWFILLIHSFIIIGFNLKDQTLYKKKSSFSSDSQMSLSMLCNAYFESSFYHSIENPYVIIEYVPYGDLLGYLRRSRGLHDCYYEYPEIKPTTNLTSEQIITFAWQIADGMQYISSKRVRVFIL